MHRIADTYGPIVYSKFGKNEANSVDTQEEAYKAFFNDLDKAVEALDAYLKEGGKEDGVKSINMSNCPTASRWIKFANSLRLRLAMRVSNVNKALAASEAKKHWKTLMVLLNHPQRTSKSPVKDIKTH